jgi:hypothetical protein
MAPGKAEVPEAAALGGVRPKIPENVWPGEKEARRLAKAGEGGEGGLFSLEDMIVSLWSVRRCVSKVVSVGSTRCIEVGLILKNELGRIAGRRR